MTNSPHIPVLQKEVLQTFENIENGTIVDATLGYAGHSSLILENKPNIKIVGIDRDDEAIEFSKNRLQKFQDRVELIKGDFASSIEKCGNIDGILADIGVSSLQLDKSTRGFSFNSLNLDMRMDTKQDFNAKDVVNSYDLIKLENIFKEYGEVREYKKLASLIVKNRPFQSANDLSNFILQNFKSKKIHPATLAFQAIRIEVNDELNQLKNLLNNIGKLKNVKVAIISFHSLEDRIVKKTFKEWTKNCICDDSVFRCECGNNHSKGKIITKKPILPSDEEISNNPRSRSSKMRVFQLD